MGTPSPKAVAFWQSLGTKVLPFADDTDGLPPLARLMRLSLFQISVGMVVVLMTGTLNRVMILELDVSASLVAIMIALPVLVAPLRVLMGYKSDTKRSKLGWRRVPMMWTGTMVQFGGLAIMPFALLLLQSQALGPSWAGPVASGLAFLLTGIGMHMTQTAGLALATDLVPNDQRSRVVAIVYVMFLVGLFLASITFSVLLADFSPMRLIQVIQGAAVATIVLNVVALWKQEARNPANTAESVERPSFMSQYRTYMSNPRAARLLIGLGIGTAGFSMQDVLLEPYGGEILGLSVSQTTLLTALWALGTLIGFAMAAHWLSKGQNMHRVAAFGGLIGIFAFSAVIFSAPLHASWLFQLGALLIGLGGGLFAVGTMLAAMELAADTDSGFAVGAWGAVQATAMGLSLALGGVLKDIINSAAMDGAFGHALTNPETGYGAVYHIEIAFLFISLAVLGPLVGQNRTEKTRDAGSFGLVDLPG